VALLNCGSAGRACSPCPNDKETSAPPSGPRRDQETSSPVKTTGPHWMGRPNFASRHHSTSLGAARELFSPASLLRDSTTGYPLITGVWPKATSPASIISQTTAAKIKALYHGRILILPLIGSVRRRLHSVPAEITAELSLAGCLGDEQGARQEGIGKLGLRSDTTPPAPVGGLGFFDPLWEHFKYYREELYKLTEDQGQI